MTPTHLKNLASFQSNNSPALAGLSQRGWSVTCGRNIELIRFNKPKIYTRLEGLSQQRPGGVTAGGPRAFRRTTPSESKAPSSLRSCKRPTGCPQQTGEVAEEQTLVKHIQCLKMKNGGHSSGRGHRGEDAGRRWILSPPCSRGSVRIPSACERCPLLSAGHSTPGQCPSCSPGWISRGAGVTGRLVLFLVQTLVCGVHSHCPNPPLIAMGVQGGDLHILDSTVLEATTDREPCGSGETLQTSSEPPGYFISPVTQLAKCKGGQRQPEAPQIGRGRRSTQILDLWIPHHWSLRPLGSGSAGHLPPLLGPVAPLVTVITASINHLLLHQAPYRNSERYCHPHFTDRKSSSQSNLQKTHKCHISATARLQTQVTLEANSPLFPPPHRTAYAVQQMTKLPRCGRSANESLAQALYKWGQAQEIALHGGGVCFSHVWLWHSPFLVLMTCGRWQTVQQSLDSSTPGAVSGLHTESELKESHKTSSHSQGPSVLMQTVHLISSNILGLPVRYSESQFPL